MFISDIDVSNISR